MRGENLTWLGHALDSIGAVNSIGEKVRILHPVGFLFAIPVALIIFFLEGLNNWSESFFSTFCWW